jgi:hypothetical protein
MSLLAMLESSKEVAMATREEARARNAEAIAEFDEIGADLAAALDAEEIETSEEMLRMAQELDEQEEQEASAREQADLELAKSLLEADEATAVAAERDEALAREIEAQLKKDTVRVAKLERRERQLAQRMLCKDDVTLAEELANEIVEEELKLRCLEQQDRKLAAQLVKGEQQVLKSLPQTEERLRSLASEINGNEPMPMRMRLRAKLNSLKKSLDVVINGNGSSDKENAKQVAAH